MFNLRLAARTLSRTPFVTIVAVVSLALGIGANSAIFSMFDQMLLRRLPVEQPDRLVNLSSPGPQSGSNSCNNAGSCEHVFSYPMYRDLEREQKVFTGVAAHRTFGANLAYKGQTASSEGMLVSGSYFPVLGVRPVIGRLFGPDDDRTPGAHPLAVLSHRYWRSRFDASPGVLGETLTINGQAMTIVGVTPVRFEGTTLGSQPDVFVPISMSAAMRPGWDGYENRRDYWIYLFARLNPGVSIDEAATTVNVPYRAIINDVEAPLQKGMSEQTLGRFRAKTVTLSNGAQGQSSVRAEAGPPLLILLAVTGVVLLIACANIANLLLARAANRSTEIAVRMSIGASRRHVMTQLLTESCLLAALGGLGGLLFARWTLDVLAALLPPEAAATVRFEMNGTILAFAAALSLGTGLLFGLFPAVHSTRPDLVSTIKGHAGQTSGARSASRFRTSLAVAQIALSMALLISAGLFTKSLFNVSRVDLGLRTDRLITFAVSPELNGYTFERARTLFQRIEEELAAVPGVSSVAASMVPLISGSNWGTGVSVQGFEAGPDTDNGTSFNEVGPGFFRTLGIPLFSGREFTSADIEGAPKVAVVNEAFAEKFNLGREAVGKRMRIGGGSGELDIEIVGLARNAKYSEVKRAVPPQFFTPYLQDKRVGSINFYIASAMDADELLQTVPKVIARLDPNLPVESLRTMDMVVRDNVFLDRLISILSASFAGLATLLAAIGLYGVLAYTVAERTREIGLRMALGAGPATIRGMVLGQVGRMAMVGAAIGVAAALGLGRLAASLLFELESYDLTVFVASTVALLAVALGAGFLPAFRASRIDPIRALRYE